MKVSVVITTYNRGRQLRRCLWSILENALNHSNRIPDEIIVCDDGPSSDDTAEVVRQCADNWRDIQISYIVNRRSGGWANPAIPRNKAIRLTNPDHELLLFLEPEMLLMPDTLQKMVDVFINPDFDIPNIEKPWLPSMRPPKRFFLTASLIAYDNTWGGVESESRWQDPPALFGGEKVDRRWPEINSRVMLVYREDIFRIGGWDEGMSGWGYDDSVSGDTPIAIRRDGIVDIVGISDVFSDTEDSDEKTRISIENTEVWSRGGWSKIRYAYRHRVAGKLYRINTPRSSVIVTGGHSLFSSGQEVSASEIRVGDVIDFVGLPQTNFHSFDPDVAWLFGFFAAEGHCGITYRKYGKEGKTSPAFTWRISNKNRELLERAETICRRFLFDDGVSFVVRGPYSCGDDAIFALDATGKKHDFVTKFRERFYTSFEKKRVPVEILNASLDAKRAFIDGYFCGDGSFDKRTKTRGYTTNSFVLARGLEQVLGELGIKISITTRKDKPDVYLLREVKTKHRKTGVTKIETWDADEYVYDIETDDHAFAAGLGCVVAHNTDAMTRLQGIGTEHLPMRFPVVHMWHDPAPADGATAEPNLRRMQEHARQGKTFVNDENWGLLRDRPAFPKVISEETWQAIQKDEELSWTEKAWPSRSGKLYRERKYLQAAADDLGLFKEINAHLKDGIWVDWGCGPLSILELMPGEWKARKIAFDPLHEAYETLGVRSPSVAYMYGRAERFAVDGQASVVTSINGIDHYQNPKDAFERMALSLKPGGRIFLHFCVNNASKGHPHPAHAIDLTNSDLAEWATEFGLSVLFSKQVHYGWRHQEAAAMGFQK